MIHAHLAGVPHAVGRLAADRCDLSDSVGFGARCLLTAGDDLDLLPVGDGARLRDIVVRTANPLMAPADETVAG